MKNDIKDGFRPNMVCCGENWVFPIDFQFLSQPAAKVTPLALATVLLNAALNCGSHQPVSLEVLLPVSTGCKKSDTVHFDCDSQKICPIKLLFVMCRPLSK